VVATPPAVPTTSSVTQPTCAVPTGTIVFNTQSNIEYSVNNGASYQASASFPGLAAGSYTLRVRSTIDNTCSTQGAPVVLAFNTPLPVLGGDSNVLVGGTANVTPSSGGTWSSSDPSIAQVDDNGEVQGIAPGTVDLTFTDDDTGCSASMPFEVIDPIADLAIFKTVSNNSPAVGANVMFTLTATNSGPFDAIGI